MRASILLICLASVCSGADTQGTGQNKAVDAAKEPVEAAKETDRDIKTYEVCPEGWVELTHCLNDDGQAETVCAKFGPPLKYVSWLHLQYECDAIGGYLPELTSTTTGPFNWILNSYNQLYGKTLMYLGAHDITHNNEWKWFNDKNPVNPANWGTDLPDTTENKGCVAEESGTGTWTNIDCEDDTMEIEVAFVCMQKPKAKSG